MPRATDGAVRVLVDHGTVEIFADSGDTVMSAQFFPGLTWSLGVDGGGTIGFIRTDQETSRNVARSPAQP